MRIFFGGPLTNLSDPQHTKSLYKKLGELAEQHGIDYYWAYQRGTDPEEDPDVPPARVYQIDEYELEKSDAMVAYVGEPSIGTGIEIEYARTRDIPVYLFYRTGQKVSRMVLGSPAVKETIVYDSEEDAITKLESLFKRLKDHHQ